VTVEFLGRALQILSAEDLSLVKLLFFRPKDLLDVKRLAALQGMRSTTGTSVAGWSTAWGAMTRG
jgi:hypothetical protein